MSPAVASYRKMSVESHALARYYKYFFFFLFFLVRVHVYVFVFRGVCCYTLEVTNGNWTDRWDNLLILAPI